MVGTGAAALGDAVRLTRAANALGFGGALLLPPFYYKGIETAALVAYVSAVIDKAGRTGCRSISITSPRIPGFPTRRTRWRACATPIPTRSWA